MKPIPSFQSQDAQDGCETRISMASKKKAKMGLIEQNFFSNVFLETLGRVQAEFCKENFRGSAFARQTLLSRLSWPTNWASQRADCSSVSSKTKGWSQKKGAGPMRNKDEEGCLQSRPPMGMSLQALISWLLGFPVIHWRFLVQPSALLLSHSCAAAEAWERDCTSPASHTSPTSRPCRNAGGLWLARVWFPQHYVNWGRWKDRQLGKGNMQTTANLWWQGCCCLCCGVHRAFRLCSSQHPPLSQFQMEPSWTLLICRADILRLCLGGRWRQLPPTGWTKWQKSLCRRFAQTTFSIQNWPSWSLHETLRLKNQRPAPRNLKANIKQSQNPDSTQHFLSFLFHPSHPVWQLLLPYRGGF